VIEKAQPTNKFGAKDDKAPTKIAPQAVLSQVLRQCNFRHNSVQPRDKMNAILRKEALQKLNKEIHDY
jgi:hypothetical protein